MVGRQRKSNSVKSPSYPWRIRLDLCEPESADLLYVSTLFSIADETFGSLFSAHGFLSAAGAFSAAAAAAGFFSVEGFFSAMGTIAEDFEFVKQQMSSERERRESEKKIEERETVKKKSDEKHLNQGKKDN
ncbi:hypothetical protein TIFTF001_018091 [Ficus carica]|uniref:Uncharacterized protein n=1 Tax=Ficus carica TaxID=3494 RepID=A0AA88ARK9_FICCA|nr:hypothetical protein TIFTF001_018091 [Ficus carica]